MREFTPAPPRPNVAMLQTQEYVDRQSGCTARDTSFSLLVTLSSIRRQVLPTDGGRCLVQACAVDSSKYH